MRAVVAGIAAALGSLAASAAGLDGLEPGEYSLQVTGAVQAEAQRLPIDAGDARVTDDELRARTVQERILYTGDTFHKPESGLEGPFEVTMNLGPQYTAMAGVEQPALMVSLHFAEGLQPGTYAIEDGFLDVGPNAAPVAVMAAAASADRETGYAFSWKVDGELTLERLDREQATGAFRFSANAMDREGKVLDKRITATGAFKAVPFTPEAELP